LKFNNPFKVIFFAPLIFLLHVVEEFPNFVCWLNALISNNITQDMFIAVNLIGFIITVLLAFFMAGTKDELAVILTLAWLSFMMFANSFIHITATIVHGYSPGVITSIFLYLPYFVWFVRCVIKSMKFKMTTIVTTVILGSLPMFLHGYWIIFKGRTLF
jgi:hypothetical protein